MSILKEKILDGVKNARETVSRKRGYEIFPETPVCGEVCHSFTSLIQDNNISTRMFELPDTVHCVLFNKDSREIIDPQYKQFIPQKYHKNLPDTLFLHIGDIGDIKSQLTKLGFQDDTAEAYVFSLKDL